MTYRSIRHILCKNDNFSASHSSSYHQILGKSCLKYIRVKNIKKESAFKGRYLRIILTVANRKRKTTEFFLELMSCRVKELEFVQV